MKMYKKVFAILMVFTMAFTLLTGCGKEEKGTKTSKNSENSSTKQESSKGEKSDDAQAGDEVTMDTIEVWTNNASTKEEDEKMIADFNEGKGKELGIQINYKIYGGDYADVLAIALAAEEGPDLFKVPQTNLAQYAETGFITPITKYPGGQEFVDTYGDALQSNYNIILGDVYTVPHTISTIGVAYNKDLLAKNGYNEPPKTWTELKEMADTITKNGNGKEFGFIEGLKSTGYVGVNGLWHYVSSVGHSEFDPVTGKFDFASMTPFVQLLADMYDNGDWFPGVEGLNNDAARAQFAEGNIGFKLSASWDAGVWQDQFPAKMDWGICRPVFDLDNTYMDYTWQTHSLALGASAMEKPEKALEVLKLFVSDDATRVLYENGKAIPAKASVIETAKMEPTTKNFDQFADMSNSKLYPLNPKGMLKVEGETMETILLKALLGAVPADEAMADLDKRYNEALDRAVADGLDLTLYTETN